MFARHLICVRPRVIHTPSRPELQNREVALRPAVCAARALRLVLAACLASTALNAAWAVPQPSSAKALLPVIEPAESAEGNFLAAVVAGSQRDTNSAAAYLREALRADPRNTELIERSFEAQLAGGNIEEAARLARQMLTRSATISLARLTLAIDAMRARQYGTARERLSIAQGAAQQRSPPRC